MVSSHILPELADICNKVGMIEQGVLLVSADVADVMKQVRQRTVLHVGVLGDPAAGRQGCWSRASLVERIEVRDGHIAGHAGQGRGRTTATCPRS